MPIQQFDLLQKSAIIDIQTDLENSIAADVLLASQWASNPENIVVADGKYSSLHYMEKANDAKIAAELAETNAEAAQGLSEDARDKAQQWAENPEDTEVEAGKYSALHWAAKAQTSAESIIESADMLIRHEAEIASLENVINSANINQELTATATGVDTVALPKTAANTGMQVQMFGQSAEQVVANGNFESNYPTPWAGTVPTLVSDVFRVGSRSGYFNVSGDISYFRKDIVCSATDKLYITSSYRLKSYTSGSTPAIRISDFGGFTNMDQLNSLTTSVVDTWYDYSYVVNGRTGGIRYTIGYFSSATVQFYVDNIKIINLTATFGAGNEPTKEQCDLLFANYFEGSDNVLGTGRVMSVGKNLFFEPKAIIQFNKVSDGVLIQDAGGYLKITGVAGSGKYAAKRIHLQGGQTYKFIVDGYKDSGAFGYIGIYNIGITGEPTANIGAGVTLPNTTRNTVVSGSVTIPSTGFYYVVYYPTLAGSTQPNIYLYSVMVVKSTVTTTTYEPFIQSALYLTTPELRSNGLIKDEIRKGTNGYELVKRVGVGTLGANGISGGDFEGGLKGTKADGDGSVSTWTLNTTNPISGTQDGRLIITTTGTSDTYPTLTFLPTRTSGQFRKLSFRYKVNSGTVNLWGFHTGGGATGAAQLTGIGIYEKYYNCNGTTPLIFYFDGRSLMDVQIDDIKDELINTFDGAATGSTATVLGSNIHYTLATPVITPIAHAGLLNSNSNGTAYFEPIIADAGVYSTNLAVQLTDYPIASFESIRKYANGTYTELSTATAVIASGGLSFTHPDLVSGDLVMFTYAYANESIGHSMTFTYPISNSNPYYNVTNSVPLTSGYYTSTTARAAVPEGVRKTGLILTYETAAGVWYTERYIGTATDTTSFTNAANWEVGVLRIASVTDTTEYAEITI